MKPKAYLSCPFLPAAAVMITLGALPAFGATGIWTQTGAGPFDWGTGGNWSGTTIADGADFTASFSANIVANQTVNLETARTIGNIVASDGSHDYTVSGANPLTLDRTAGAIPVINVTPAGRSLTISSVINGSDGLDKWGAGQLVLNGSAVNGFTGGVKVSSGTLNLNFANLATPTDLVNSGNSLTLGGGTLLVTGNSTTNTNQTLGNLAVNAGGGQILVNPNGASRTATLNLGTITPAATGSLLIGKSSGSSGTATITTTSGTLTNGIYGGNMVFFNGTANTGYDWATTATSSPGPYTISGLGTYTAVPNAGTGGSSTTNYQITTTSPTALTGDFAVNTLKMAPNTTNSVVFDLGTRQLTVESGGLMFTGSGTGNRITNGTVTAGAGSDYKLFIHNYNSQFSNTAASNPGIGAAITNNGANAVAVVMQGNPGANLFELASTSNSFTGGLYLNNASVRLGAGAGTINDNTMYVSGYSVLYNPNFSNASAIQLSDGAMLDFRNNVGTYTTSGAVTGKGGIVLGQAGGGRSEAVFNSVNNTFSGPVEYRVTPNAGQDGILRVNSMADAEVLGSGDIRFGVAGTGTNSHIFHFGGTSGAPNADLTFDKRRFELTGSHALSQINNNTARNFTINTDLLTTGTGVQTLTLGGTGAGLSTFAGDIANGTITTLNITKGGSAIWTLSGDNSFNGTLTLSGASVNSQLNINSATALGTGTFTISGGNNAKIDATGGDTVNSNNNAMIWSNDFAFVGTNNLDLGTGAVTMGGTRTVTVTAKSLTVGGDISGTGFALNKAGAGTLALGGNNGYTGATNVNNGTLLINGSTSTSSVVTVAAAGTLGGTGVVGGNTTVSGQLKPGAGAGVLDFGGLLTLDLTSLTTMDINGLTRDTQYDGVNATGALAYGGDLVINFGSLPGSGTFDLFNIMGGESGDFTSVSLAGAYTGSLTFDTVDSWSLTDSGNTWTFTQSTGDLVFTAVPEPGSALLGAIGLLLLLRRRR